MSRHRARSTSQSTPALLGMLAGLVSGSACGGPPAQSPNPRRSVDEGRAIPIIARTFQESGETPNQGRELTLPSGKAVHIDVGAVGHKFGVSYLTPSDLAPLDLKRDLPPHQPDGDLPIVQGSGSDSDAVVLVLFADDYQYDDLVGDKHELTNITAEKRLTRDVRDFLVQAHARKLP